MAQSVAARWLGIQPPAARVERWHVSAPVDLSAYAFSWLVYLVPALVLGRDHPAFVGVILVGAALTEVHRHFTFPYVYGDREVLGRYPLRFLLFPAALTAAFVFSPWLAKARWVWSSAEVAAVLAQLVVVLTLLGQDKRGDRPATPWLLGTLALGWGLPAALVALGASTPPLGPATWPLLGACGIAWAVSARPWERGSTGASARGFGASTIALLALTVAAAAFGPTLDARLERGGLRPRVVLNAVATFAFLWNIWHVYAQKYGILRMYDAKAGDATRVPGWVDRTLVFAWVPLFFAWVGPANEEHYRRSLARGGALLDRAMDLAVTHASWTVPLTALGVVAAHGLWLWQEHRHHGLRNQPRLAMAAGTTLLSACFVVFDPVVAFAAFAFSHAIEYIVFLWAFLRKKYDAPLPHRPFTQRALQRPWLAYGVFGVGLGLFFIWGHHWGGSRLFPEAARPKVGGFKVVTWLYWWTVYQSMMHFYWDGFLWKMRKPAVRANV